MSGLILEAGGEFGETLNGRCVVGYPRFPKSQEVEVQKRMLSSVRIDATLYCRIGEFCVAMSCVADHVSGLTLTRRES